MNNALQVHKTRKNTNRNADNTGQAHEISDRNKKSEGIIENRCNRPRLNV